MCFMWNLGYLREHWVVCDNKRTLWSNFDLVLSAGASSLIANEAFSIASCMHLFLYPLWMR